MQEENDSQQATGNIVLDNIAETGNAFMRHSINMYLR